MAQIHVIGRITADLELKYGQSKNPYIRFDLAENIGKGSRARVQYYQVWAWGEDAIHLINSKARKGSLLCVTGSLELETYTKQDGITTDKRLKISLGKFDFIPTGNRRSMDAPAQFDSAVDNPTALGGIDGDREPLPV